jgi:hypothetical protein
MRILRLTMGLLIVLVFANAAAADETQQGDSSYLPPASLRATPETAPAYNAQRASAETRRGVKVVHRGHMQHARHGRRFAGQRFLFGIF